MAAEVVAAPPATVPQEGTEQAPAVIEAGNEAKVSDQQPEVDFERILAGDEAYTAETNARLSGESAPAKEDAAKPDEKQEAKPEAKEKAAPPAPEEDDEPLIFRGKARPVPKEKKAQRDLMQKGLALDARTQELAPLIALEREAPELVNLARTPEGRKQIIERIRQQEKAKDEAEAEIPEVYTVDENGNRVPYQKADVEAVAKIAKAQLQAQLKAMGITGRDAEKALTPERIKQAEADQAEMAREAALTIRVMRRADRDFEPKYQMLQQIMAKAERELPPAQFADLYNKINDPRILHPETGEPVFTHFWEHVVTPEFNKSRQSTQSAAPVVPAIPPKVQASSGGRMAPGAAHSPASATPVISDWSKVPDDAFNRAFDEALRRG